MSAIGLIITLIVIGVALYLIGAVKQIDPTIKTIIYAVVLVLVLLWLLNIFSGVIPDYRIGR